MTTPLKNSNTLSNIKTIIAVASGKGGVGKSTVAVNLAVALAKQGKHVGLLDADIYGPSQHIMMGLRGQEPVLNDQKKILPVQKHGVSVMSFGFFVKPEDAVVWRGPMIAKTFQQFVFDVEWGKLDYLIVDLPPGTGDIQLTLSQTLNVTGVVIVSTPQDVALADAIKGVNMFQKVEIKVLGIIENMSYFNCPECGHKTPIFSNKGVKNKAAELGVPFLGELPLEEATRASGDEGIPIVAKDPLADQSKRFFDMALKIEQMVEKMRATAPSEKTSPSYYSKSFDV